MNTKLTLTLDPHVIDLAKRYAKNQGTSVSKLVEKYFTGLQDASKDEDPKLTGVVKELAGVIDESEIDDFNLTIADYLEEKHQ